MINLNCDRALRIQGKTARQATLERLCAWISVSAVSNHPPRTPRATRQQPTPSGHPENTQIQAKIISISPKKKKPTFLTTTTVHDWERRSVQISISFAQNDSSSSTVLVDSLNFGYSRLYLVVVAHLSTSSY